MRFKKGDKVEVMNTSEVPISWHTAEIVSDNGHTCTVRHGSGLEMRSENFEERVSRKMIRPCPTVVHHVETWALGDIVEGCVQAGAKRSNKISAQDCCQKMKSQLLPLDALTKVLGETDGLATHGKNRGQESCIISSRSQKRMSPYCTSGVDSLYGNAQKFQAIETDNCRLRAALAMTLQEKHMKLRFEDIIDQSHAFSRAKIEACMPCFHMYKDDAGM